MNGLDKNGSGYPDAASKTLRMAGGYIFAASLLLVAGGAIAASGSDDDGLDLPNPPPLAVLEALVGLDAGNDRALKTDREFEKEYEAREQAKQDSRPEDSLKGPEPSSTAPANTTPGLPEFSASVLQYINAPGAQLLGQPKKVATVTPKQIEELLKKTPEGKLYYRAAPTLKCSLNVYSYNYTTVGGAGEPTNSSGVIMIPFGDLPVCKGAKPVVIFAHGTSPTVHYDLSKITDTSNDANDESLIMAAFFASQGYLAVGPNYAGYHNSKLGYHPYLNGKQQGTEMVDALKTGLRGVQYLVGSGQEKLSLSDRIFVSGYSQGGYVGMAALKAIEEQKLPVTAAATLSGPYALGAFGDRILQGQVAVGATVFIPMMVTSYQKAYGNIYRDMKDLYASPYDQDSPDLLPTSGSVGDIFKKNKLPITQIFQIAPTSIPQLDPISPPTKKYTYGFSPANYLVNTPYRQNYVTDMVAHPDYGALKNSANTSTADDPKNTFRQALKLNDLRDYTPKVPLMLCAGHRDPTVIYEVDTGLMTRILQKKALDGVPLQFASIDIDNHHRPIFDETYVSYGLPEVINATMARSTATTQQGFQSSLTQILTETKQKAKAKGQNRVQADLDALVMFAANYHVNFVMPYCAANATEFFNQYR